MAATGRSFPDIVQLLLDKGADTTPRWGDHFIGSTALNLAVTNNDERLVNMLLKHGANILDGSFDIAIKVNKPNMISLLTKWTNNPMAPSLKYGGMLMVQKLLDHGFNKEQALLDAVESGYEQLFNDLLERGTDPDAPSIQGNNAVHAAISYRNAAIMETLLRHGVCIHPEDLKSA